MRTDLEARLRGRHLDDGYVLPSYGPYSFANVPHTVRSVVDAPGDGRPLPADALPAATDGYARVLLAVVDGFGLAQWKRYRDVHPLLERLETRGRGTPLSTIYPSETAAAMTTVHTGTLPSSHGVLGWDVYDPADDASYEAFSTEVVAGDESVSYDLQEVFEGDPLYPDLVAAGVDCHHVVPFPETYDGAVCHTYGDNRADDHVHDLDGFAERLREAGEAADDPAYLFAYLPQIDTVAHARGTHSDAYRETVRATVEALECGLAALHGALEDPAETLVLITADHGHVDTDPDRNVDLEGIDGVMENLDRHADGEPVRYAGSPRNVHLHLREPAETRRAVRETLTEALDARVFTREEALDRALFGAADGSETFRRRLGDLVVCHRDLGVWYGSDRAKLELIGMHGGLHPDEMLVPLAAVDLSKIQP